MLGLIKDLIYISKRFEKKREYWELFFLILSSSLIISLAALSSIKSLSHISVGIAVSTFLIIFVGSYFFAYLILIGFNALKENGNYMKALNAVGLSLSLFAAGYLISVLLMMIPAQSFWALLISTIAAMVFVTALFSAFVLLIKLCSILFKSDIITSKIILMVILTTLYILANLVMSMTIVKLYLMML